MPTTRAKKPVTRKTSKPAPTLTQVSHEHIQLRAFEIFQTRMRTHTPGDHVSDWFQAEAECRGRATPRRS